MSTDIFEQLGIMQLSDSFFPSGIYATSNGLEILIHDRKIKNATELAELIKVFLRQQIGPADCVALCNVYDFIAKNDFEKIIQTDQLLYSMKLVKEIRETSTRAGIQLIKCIQSFKDEKFLKLYSDSITIGKCTGVYPVCFAIAAYGLGVKKENAATMLLYGFVVGMIGAALRMGIIEHFESQKIIDDLKSEIVNAVQKNIKKSISEMWQFAPELDIVQITHEKLAEKMFIT
ncbi:MAG: urease accessory protein [Thaumarchaeota archaeon]|nr:urease accessory protein [Nitrososphaerota archaeon]